MITGTLWKVGASGVEPVVYGAAEDRRTRFNVSRGGTILVLSPPIRGKLREHFHRVWTDSGGVFIYESWFRSETLIRVGT